jgi:hypothetical protein
MVLKKGQKGVMSVKEAARRAEVLRRKANFKRAKKGDPGAIEEVKKSGKKPTGE